MIFFVSRHAGASEWARQQGLRWDLMLAHMQDLPLSAGDRVYGTLPCPLAAAVCEAGAEYWHLHVPMQPDWRGRELSASQLTSAGARFVRFEVRQVDE